MIQDIFHKVSWTVCDKEVKVADVRVQDHECLAAYPYKVHLNATKSLILEEKCKFKYCELKTQTKIIYCE